MLASKIEALADRQGFVKFASGAAWNFVDFAYFDVKQQAEPFEPASQGSGVAGGRGRGSTDPWSMAPGSPPRDIFAKDPTTFMSREELGKAANDLKEIRRFYAGLEAMRMGRSPCPKAWPPTCVNGDVTIDEFVEFIQAAMENLAAEKATTLAAALRDAKDGQGTTDYVGSSS